MKTENLQPTQCAHMGTDTNGSPVSPEDGLARGKRQRRAPKPFEPEPEKPKRRRISINKQLARDSGGKFVKRTSTRTQSLNSTTDSKSNTPLPDPVNDVMKAPAYYPATSAFLPRVAVACALQKTDSYVQHFVDSIMNFPDENADSPPCSPAESSLQDSDSAVSGDVFACTTSRSPSQVEVPAYLTRTPLDADCSSEPLALHLPVMDDFMYLPSPDEDTASSDVWNMPVDAEF